MEQTYPHARQKPYSCQEVKIRLIVAMFHSNLVVARSSSLIRLIDINCSLSVIHQGRSPFGSSTIVLNISMERSQLSEPGRFLTWTAEESEYCDRDADDEVENEDPAPRGKAKSAIHILMPRTR